MKKFIIFILFVGLFFIIPSKGRATSGACSSHNGVDCSAGADFDGSVICNDGWRNSSVKYSEMAECSGKDKYYCTQDEYEYLNGKYGINSLLNDLEQKNNLLSLKNEEYNKYSNLSVMVGSSEWREKLSLATEITGIANQVISIQGSIKIAQSSVDKECQLLGESSRYKQLAKSLEDLNNKKDAFACGDNSQLIGNKCFCNDGYLALNNKCETYSEACQYKYGEYTYGDKKFCHCFDGYIWNEGRTACIKKPEQQCPNNANIFNNVCYCNSGYIFNIDKTSCVKITQYVTVNKTINLREKASASSKVIGLIKKNIKYQIIDLSNNEWVKIKYSNSREGYVLKRLVKVN